MKYHVYHFLSIFYNLHFSFFYISCEQPWKSCKTVCCILRDCKVFLEMDQNLGFSMPANRVFSTSHAVFYEITITKSRQASFHPAFKECDVLMPKGIPLHSYRTIIHYIEKRNRQSKFILSTWDYLRKYFVKTVFIHLFEIFCWVLWSKYCFQ